jgi:hypothetical protein
MDQSNASPMAAERHGRRENHVRRGGGENVR